ncbi:hypothetical protein VTJ04DRAFT_8659 [Mycothermus thermophilus]|uniref:uncharacterized protein n=1 Tax=Humicola insolens TaxID=85995 RepID=UPI0037440CDA
MPGSLFTILSYYASPPSAIPSTRTASTHQHTSCNTNSFPIHFRLADYIISEPSLIRLRVRRILSLEPATPRWSSNLVHRYNFRLLTTHAGIPPDVWLGLFRFRSTSSLNSARKDSIYPGSSCVNNVISITSQLRHWIRQTLSRGLVDVSHPQDSSTGDSGYTWWSTFRLEPGFSSLDSSNNTTIRPGLELITLNIN